MRISIVSDCSYILTVCRDEVPYDFECSEKCPQIAEKNFCEDDWQELTWINILGESGKCVAKTTGLVKYGCMISCNVCGTDIILKLSFDIQKYFLFKIDDSISK